MKYCCLCCLVFAKFCFVGWFLRVSVLVRTKSFRKKKINKLEIVLITSFYYTTDLRQLWALPWLLLIALLFHHIFTTSATVLSGIFYPQVFFTLRSFPTFSTTCFYQGFPGSWQFFLEGCRASHWSLKHRPGPSVCLNHTAKGSAQGINR